MPIGVCKLCLQQRELQDSHFIPRAVYKCLRTPKDKNPNPVVVGRRITCTTSRQMKDYVLCADCEERFNKNGETWMMRQLWNGQRFPLGDRLNVALPHYTFERAETLVFSGTAVGIETAKLGYFALSVFWRAAVHAWKMPHGEKTRKINLGFAEEPIRKFLLGQASFPKDVVLMVTVCTDKESKGSFYVPSQVFGTPIVRFAFLALGVHFMRH